MLSRLEEKTLERGSRTVNGVVAFQGAVHIVRVALLLDSHCIFSVLLQKIGIHLVKIGVKQRILVYRRRRKWIQDCIVSHFKVVPVLHVALTDSAHIRGGVTEDRRSLVELFPIGTGRKPAPLLQNKSCASSVCRQQQRALCACMHLKSFQDRPAYPETPP